MGHRYEGMQDCDCVSNKMASEPLRPDHVIYKRVQSSKFGWIDLTAQKDCEDCGGTGYTPEGLEFRRAARMLRAHGWTVIEPETTPK